MAARALAPLVRMAAATRQIDVAGLQQRLPLRGAGDELDEVAQAFNETLARLEQTVGEMRQFSTAIAHELRTPLAVLRGETELALMQARRRTTTAAALTDQLEELDKLSRLVSQLLTLARAEAGRDPAAARRRSTCRRWPRRSPSSSSRSRRRRASASPRDVAARSIVIGDAGWLERLLLNLLDNAIKFTPAGGRIAVARRPRAGRTRCSRSATPASASRRTRCRTSSSGSSAAIPRGPPRARAPASA